MASTAPRPLPLFLHNITAEQDGAAPGKDLGEVPEPRLRVCLSDLVYAV
jgi:hypothetical protein